MVSWQVERVVDRGRGLAHRRLPDLVRAGDGRVQRLGGRVASRAAGDAACGTDCAQSSGRRRGVDARPAASQPWCAGPRGSLRVPPEAVVLMKPSPPIAVVGVSAPFPGSADGRGFWRDILAGKDLLTEVPETHWLIEDY